MADIKVYRTYEHDRDPVLDQVHGMVEKERLAKKLGIVAEISGLSRQTLSKWFDGTTRRPQYATVMAVAVALGYHHAGFRQTEKFEVEAARKAAKKWVERQEAKKKAAKERLIAARKAAKAAGSPRGVTLNRS